MTIYMKGQDKVEVLADAKRRLKRMIEKDEDGEYAIAPEASFPIYDEDENP